MGKLTLNQLQEMEPGTIINKGESVDNPEGINMTNSGKPLRWIAVRGDIEDWVIYCYWAWQDYDYARTYGDKIQDEKYIRKLIPCEDDAFKKYRH